MTDEQMLKLMSDFKADLKADIKEVKTKLDTTHDQCTTFLTKHSLLETSHTEVRKDVKDLSKWRWITAGMSSVGLGLHGIPHHGIEKVATAIKDFIFGGQS